MAAVEGHQPPAPLVKAFNGVLRVLLPSPLGRGVREFLLLAFTGRRSGRRYRVPVTAHRDAAGLYVLTPAGWRHNFAGGADADVKFAGRTTPMRGVLLDDEAVVVALYLDRITELGLRGAARQIGLRFPAGRLPTRDEVTELVRREHFGVVRLSAPT
ncbi:hypothetical protein M8542_27860 [Amycolatopsis sp. OK19-0408]|uniref:Deazaflavin-dependent oxidoreductase (Nitroreductase family) n=1 Tax=Amycolatopsis iheyensis TaxID=2945988 RepID=A0A9X2NH79_9PSEU|nr:hypothetical protein [Amycolatopsis iheyensis]MCR6486649.1 hypothetical protein [Amycolatopsis iheyensis]